MKKINYLFYLGVVVIIFSIVSPIYWQYEVNEFHDATYFYKIYDFEGETVEKSYNILEKYATEGTNTFYIVRPTSSENIDLIENKYYFDTNHDNDDYTVGNAIKFTTNDSSLISFSESNGYIYSDISYEELNAYFHEQSITFSQSEDIYENDLSRFLFDNALPIIAVIFFTLIISIVLTLKDVKEVALLSLHGFSDLSIKMRLTLRTFKNLLISEMVVFVVFVVLTLFKGDSISATFFRFYLIVLSLILMLYMLVYFISFTTMTSVNIVSVLKNRDYTKSAYMLLMVIQCLIIIFVPLLFSSYLTNFQDVENTKNEISRIYQLENYYTYYGTNANYYDSLSDDQLSSMNENFKALYNDNIEHSYYFDPTFAMYLQQYGESIYQMPQQNNIYMDVNYYNAIAKFSTIPASNIRNNTLLIPESFKENTEEIINNLNLIDKNVDVIYIVDNIELYYDDFGESLSEEISTFKKIGKNNIIVITSPNNLENHNPYANTVFIESMSNGSVFFKLDDLTKMMELTVEYKLEKLVTAQSKISPYYNMLYDLEYYYNIAIYTLFLTLLSVIVINTFAAEIVVNNKKKLIAVGFLHGKNILYSLKNNFILYTFASIVAVLSMMTLNLLTIETAIMVLGLYFYICIYLMMKYYNFVNAKIANMLKGE
ncbi:MAG: hypothetical protein ACRC7V_00450 [Lachnospiraceae bacterium]